MKKKNRFEVWLESQSIDRDACASQEWFCHSCEQNYTEDEFSCYKCKEWIELTGIDNTVICNGKREHYCSEECLQDYFDDYVLPEIKAQEEDLK